MKAKKGKAMRKRNSLPVKSRKEIRKEIRKGKKLRRSRQYRTTTHEERNDRLHESDGETSLETFVDTEPEKTAHLSTHSQAEVQHLKEQRDQKKLSQEMIKSRKRTLLAANEEEDLNIRKLEKLLKLNRHRRKSLTKSFIEDGLSYVLDVCNPSSLKESARAEQAFQDSDSDLEEEFANVKGRGVSIRKSRTHSARKDDSLKNHQEDDKSDVDMENESDLGSDSDNTSCNSTDNDEDDSSPEVDGKNREDEISLDDSFSRSEDDEQISIAKGNGKKATDVNSKLNRRQNASSSAQPLKKDTNTSGEFEVPIRKNKKTASPDVTSEDDVTDYSDDGSSDNSESCDVKGKGRHVNGTWEDIYGRTRDKEGNIIENKSCKYIPPALRAKLFEDTDSNRKEQLLRLKRQLKGHINRLAEKNMANISAQIEELYMAHSRHDMNSTLLLLCSEALISPVLTPERLVMEHILLISTLHANVGSEVGAHFVQSLVKRFQETLDTDPEVENKELDNIILIISHLYNFKVLHASLLFEILDKIAELLNEKRIELLLVVLRSVGFTLRKDDPVALKALILKLQNKASSTINNSSSGSRMRFMLDILLAIKNNNMSKIPSYDPEYIEHLKKLQRSLLRRGNYVTELKITLEDLLKVEERGRWWIVGSAWMGHLPGENSNSGPSMPSSVNSSVGISSSYSLQLLDLARKQRMNTGVRKDIFCILMTAEDYMDAFEKLLHLGLKNQQRQEIVHVLFDCCLQERTFNPFYAHLAQRFCDFDRQFQMMFQYCLWDKLKEVDQSSNTQISNMAQFLAHLFLNKGLPLSVLKVLSFAEISKACVRLVRQVLLAIFLSKDVSASEAVFQRICHSPKLRLFREGMRLFVSHFVLHKIKKMPFSEEEAALLNERAKAADKILSAVDSAIEF